MEIALPHTIEHTTGEKLTFLRITTKNGIEYLGKNEVQPHTGPPMHVHHKQDECMTVISGKMGYQALGEEKNTPAQAKLYYSKQVQHTKLPLCHAQKFVASL